MAGNQGNGSSKREWLVLLATLPPIAFWCWVLICFSLWAPLLCRLMQLGQKHKDGYEVEAAEAEAEISSQQQRSASSCKVRRWFMLAISIPLVVCSMIVTVNFVSMFLEPLHSTLLYPSSTTVQHNPVRQGQDNDDAISVYIPGAGFSGFFYTLGRLQNLLHSTQSTDSSHQHEYFCFSAGCLALVASLLNLPINHTIELGHSSRDRWMAGEMGRYDVVGHFVDGLLSNIANENVNAETDYAVQELAHNLRHNRTRDSPEIEWTNATMNKTLDVAKQSGQSQIHTIQKNLPRINIITSAWNHKQYHLSQNIQRPSNLQHLKKLLVQTTWM